MQQLNNSRAVHRGITEQIVAAIRLGAPKFEMPWHLSGPALQRPANVVTTKRYRGVNVLALWVAAQSRGYATGYWASYRQWNALGAQVRKGERGSLIVFYKEVASAAESEEEEPARRLIARASYVFNSAQVEGWEAPSLGRSNLVERIGHAELFVQETGAEIREGGDSACYRVAADRIEMPRRESFVGTGTSSATEAYYATLLHELTHWTGHRSRLDRDLTKRFGGEACAMEELVAELGAAFLCADLSVANAPRLDHAAYIQSWLRVLEDDKRAVFTAAARASDAVDYLMAQAAWVLR